MQIQTQPARPSTAHQLLDQRLLAAIAGLFFLSIPAVAALAGSGLAAQATLGAAVVAAIPVLTRLRRLGRLAWATCALIFIYVIGAVFFAQDQGQATKFAITTFAGGMALLLFASYGKEILAYRGFRFYAFVLVAVGIVSTYSADLPKNSTGGVMLYLVAFGITMLIATRPLRSWFYVALFFGASAALALALDFRGLLGYTAVLVLGYWGSLILSRRTYWLAGIAGCVAVIWAVTWYFLNVFTSPLAIDISRQITEESGRRATSGREILWPALVRYVGEDHRWFGRGVDQLPEQFLHTTLSSHSFYMQTYLQVGIFGLAVLAFLLLTVWKTLSGAVDEAGRFGAALFLMFVVHNATEVLMFQIGMSSSIPAWCAIGVAYAAVQSRASETEAAADEPATTSAPVAPEQPIRRRGAVPSSFAR